MSEERDFKLAREQYKLAKIEYVPVRTPRGAHVHATTLQAPTTTACARFRGPFLAVAAPLSCPECLLAVFPPTRKPSKRRRRGKRRKR